MATIREVAKLAGVSIATVSRILNQDETYKTTEQTKQKVWSAVNELNYIPNNTARGLSKKYKKTDTTSIKIGCILSITKEKYTDPYYMAILGGVESQLNKKGYSLSVLRTCKELDDKKILYDTIDDSLTGLIIMDSLKPEIYNVIRNTVPFLVGIDIEDSTIDNICYDRYNSAKQAMNHLISKGHKRIGYIGGPAHFTEDFSKEERLKGYMDTLRDANIAIDNSIIKDCQWSRSLCYKKTIEILEHPNRPTAIFVGSDPMAAIALTAIYDKELRVPNDIAVIGVSNIEMSQYTSPPLTTINVPKREMGIAAADTLLARILGDVSLPKRIILPTSLTERSSV
jgi:LacI family transcriptional regulator